MAGAGLETRIETAIKEASCESKPLSAGDATLSDVAARANQQGCSVMHWTTDRALLDAHAT